MNLSELAGVLGLRLRPEEDRPILSLAADSRKVAKGALFAAIPGTRLDGMSFVAKAVEAGAAALLVSNPVAGISLPQLVVENVRSSLSRLANAFYGRPSESLDLVGITGTNGKTTTAFLIQHIINQTRCRCGLIGTVGIDLGQGLGQAEMTTPDSIDFFRDLHQMVENGCGAAVTEVSSHALHQSRVDGARFVSGVFTNLTRDHLDYHGNMENYAAAKALLFQQESLGWSILNQDDAGAQIMAEKARGKILHYGMGTDADLRGIIETNTLEGINFSISYQGEEHSGTTYLTGLYNMHNILAAVGASMSLGIHLGECLKAVASFRGVPGRLERVTAEQGPSVFVDYAHTDDALRNVLTVLRPLVKGRLIVLFGCGGDRDRGKRPLMARVAEECADSVVLTSDNPRTEDPQAILDDVRRGFLHPERVRVEPDRALAVEEAIGSAHDVDTVLLAGKGHEDYQIIGKVKIHLDDRELALAALKKRRKSRTTV